MYTIWVTGFGGFCDSTNPFISLEVVINLEGARHGELCFLSPFIALIRRSWVQTRILAKNFSVNINYLLQEKISMLLQNFLSCFLPKQFCLCYLDPTFPTIFFLLNLKQVVGGTFCIVYNLSYQMCFDQCTY